MTFDTALADINAAGYVLYTLHQEEPWCADILGRRWFCTVRRTIDKFTGQIGNGRGNTPAEAMDEALQHALSDDAVPHDHRDCYGGVAPDESRPSLSNILSAIAPQVPPTRRKLR